MDVLRDTCGTGVTGCCLAQLKQKISHLEKAALTDKPWQLMGETQASKRPLNALLEEDLEFDQQTKAGACCLSCVACYIAGE